MKIWDLSKLTFIESSPLMLEPREPGLYCSWVLDHLAISYLPRLHFQAEWKEHHAPIPWHVKINRGKNIDRKRFCILCSKFGTWNIHWVSHISSLPRDKALSLLKIADPQASNENMKTASKRLNSLIFDMPLRSCNLGLALNTPTRESILHKGGMASCPHGNLCP